MLHGLSLIAEKALTFSVHPYLRARLLSLLGATVGKNVRVYEARFFNLQDGFRNLELADDVHVGTGCLLDLTDAIRVGAGAVISPRVTVLTHTDMGSHHNSPLSGLYPPMKAPVAIGAGSFVGANSTILAGTVLGERSLVAAGSIVSGNFDPGRLIAGAPARDKRPLD